MDHFVWQKELQPAPAPGLVSDDFGWRKLDGTPDYSA
jgi:hypothetical protein